MAIFLYLPQIAVFVVLLGALWIVLSGDRYDPSAKQFATGITGLIVGWYLRYMEGGGM